MWQASTSSNTRRPAHVNALVFVTANVTASASAYVSVHVNASAFVTVDVSATASAFVSASASAFANQQKGRDVL